MERFIITILENRISIRKDYISRNAISAICKRTGAVFEEYNFNWIVRGSAEQLYNFLYYLSAEHSFKVL